MGLWPPTPFASFLNVFQSDLLSTSVHIRPPRLPFLTRLKTMESWPPPPGMAQAPQVCRGHTGATQSSTQGVSWERVDNKGPFQLESRQVPGTSRAGALMPILGRGDPVRRRAHSFFLSLFWQIPSPKV